MRIVEMRESILNFCTFYFIFKQFNAAYNNMASLKTVFYIVQERNRTFVIQWLNAISIHSEASISDSPDIADSRDISDSLLLLGVCTVSSSGASK